MNNIANQLNDTELLRNLLHLKFATIYVISGKILQRVTRQVSRPHILTIF